MSRRQRQLLLLAAVVVVGISGATLYHLFGRPAPETEAAAVRTVAALDVGEEPAVPAIWVDVHSPAPLRKAALKNAWLQQTLNDPLGQGFLGSWSGFLGTRGSEAALGFDGPVVDVLIEQVFDSPFRITWFSGAGATSTPAVILPKLSGTAKSAVALLDKARESSTSATSCPGGQTLPTPSVSIGRWVLAEHALYAYPEGDRLILARHPLAVLHALCDPGEPLKGRKDVDVEMHLSATHLGREVQTLASALGLGESLTLGMGLEGDRLVPRGVHAEVLVKDRLGKAALPKEALQLLPSDTALVLSLQVPLPVPLSAESLQGYWKGESKGARENRHVLLAWQPRGDSNLPQEWSLVWGRAADLPALGSLFSDGTFASAEVCGQAVIASNAATLERLRQTCSGKIPSLLNAAAPVVEGLRAPGSIGVGVNLGALLSQLMIDGFASEHGTSFRAAPPAEIEEARRHLQTLPFLGFRGTAEGTTLVPGGFGS